MGMSKGKNFHEHMITLELIDPVDYENKDSKEAAILAKKRAKRIKWFDNALKRKKKNKK